MAARHGGPWRVAARQAGRAVEDLAKQSTSVAGLPGAWAGLVRPPVAGRVRIGPFGALLLTGSGSPPGSAQPRSCQWAATSASTSTTVRR